MTESGVGALEFRMNSTGWAAIAVAVIILAIVGLRLITFGDMKDDEGLMGALEMQLMTEYLPDDVESLEAAYEAGDIDETDRLVEMVTSTDLNIESVQVSSPMLDIASSGELVVKVRYSLDDDSGTREKGTKYYIFEQGPLGGAWEYQYETSAVSYYLNFI